MNIFNELKAEWVWLPQDEEIINQYVDFRHEFFLDKVSGMPEEEGLLYISIDTEYAVWINGVFVDCGQYDDYPDRKSYDVLDVRNHLKVGQNVLCILGYYQGENSFQYIKGRPGLVYSLKVNQNKFVSSSNTFCRQSAAYKSGAIEKISPQLLFTFEYNAANYDEWLLNDYIMPSSWVKAEIKTAMLTKIELYRRPIHKLTIAKPVTGRITAQGLFIRNIDTKNIDNMNFTIPTPAELMQSDYLSSRLPMEIFQKDCGYSLKVPSAGLNIGNIPDGNDGVYIFIDMQREEAGLFELELEGEDGVRIDTSYGQQVDDLRVRASIGGRNFAFKYTCSNGYQKFTHYIKRIAGRYIQLHISGIKKGITIYYAGIRPVKYPLLLKGSFSSNDRLLNKIHEVSVRTLELCMHEHYEDTPWREQALYAMDSRNQALCGYYCFGEYDFAESSFSLLAQSLKDDGYLEICAPAEDRITIPSFSIGWIMAVADLVLYSGKIETAEKLFPAVKKMLNMYIGNMSNGLLVTPSGDRYWNFYEWADGLDGGWTFDAPFKSGDFKRFDAPLNLFLCLALEAGTKLAKWTSNFEEEALYLDCLSKLRNAIQKAFWNDEKGAYKTYIGDNCVEHYAELTQALALSSNVSPNANAEILRKRLSEKNNSLVPTTLSYSLFKYEALLQEPDKYTSSVFDEIADDWGHMLYNKATSFWETIKGADDFEKAGSLCHGWSAIPIYFFQAYILGVKPLEPGFRKFKVSPLLQVAGKASGKVPTPFGDINVFWEGTGKDSDYKISFPDTITRV